MFTICVPLLSSECSGPADATVVINWFGNSDPSDCDNVIFAASSAWTNPCATSYAISYYYEGWADIPTPTLLATSAPYTATIPPGASFTALRNWGPYVDPFWTGALGRVKMIVTWPDTTVTTYTSDDDFITPCN